MSGPCSDSVPSVEYLLGVRNAICVDLGGQLVDVEGYLPTWQRLWREFGPYVAIRDWIVCGPGRVRFFADSMVATQLVAHLVDMDLLDGSAHEGYAVASEDARQRLTGSWLEELGAVVALDAGADEVRYSQRLTWRSRFGSEVYQNEIDVLARYGDRLAFVSCKALAPWGATDPKGIKRIFDAMKEVAYWRQHFGAGKGQAILLTTVDFIDEQRNRYRNAGLIERADVLGVQLVSADAGDYDGLVAAFKEAVQSP